MHACEECTFSKRCFAAQIAVSLQWEQRYKGKKVVIIQHIINRSIDCSIANLAAS